MGYIDIKRIIKKESNALKQICFGAKRLKIIKNPILVNFIEMNGTVKSLYLPVDTNDKICHLIFIDKESWQNKKEFIETIRYQLVRVFCVEYFYELRGYIDIYSSKSQVLIAVLQFLKFRYLNKEILSQDSKLYKVVNDVESFEELQLVIAMYAINSKTKAHML